MKLFNDLFLQIISPENLFLAWEEFRSDKQKKLDVCNFELNVEQHIFKLHRELVNKTYKHGSYIGFYINDPKRRHIHKAIVRDRVLHHAIFRILNPIFELMFIPNSFSCRIGKGTHKGVLAVDQMIRKESANYTKPCFILKCDVKKFFDSVNHKILLKILERKIKDDETMWLLDEIVSSFPKGQIALFKKRGLPIGNLTSQLFANIYMNELDQLVKHKLKVKNYARYTDDFLIISQDTEYLEKLVKTIESFLSKHLNLLLHPEKISIRKFNQGIDFLGYIVLPHYKLVRTKTRKRIFRKVKDRIREYKYGLIDKNSLDRSFQSYLGIFTHANAFRISKELKNKYWFWLKD